MNCLGITIEPDSDPNSIARAVIRHVDQLADAAAHNYREGLLHFLDIVPLHKRINAACELSQARLTILHDLQPDGKSTLLIQLQIENPERFLPEAAARIDEVMSAEKDRSLNLEGKEVNTQ